MWSPVGAVTQWDSCPGAQVCDESDADGDAEDGYGVHGEPSGNPNLDGGEVATARLLILLFHFLRLGELVRRVIVNIFFRIVLENKVSRLQLSHENALPVIWYKLPRFAKYYSVCNCTGYASCLDIRSDKKGVIKVFNRVIARSCKLPLSFTTSSSL